MSRDSTQQQIIVAVESTLGCRAIPVLHGWFALVDHEDYDSLAKHLWYTGRRGYAVRTSRGVEQRCLYMHTAIMAPPPGMTVDHINHNKLDNRRANLRVCREESNHFNQPMRRDNTTGFKGVYRRRDKWRAQLTANGKHHYLGCFERPEDAARAYDVKALEMFGEFAALNFPEGG